MKKKILLTLCLFLLICFISCGAFLLGRHFPANKPQTTFYAKIEKISANFFVVQGLPINDINSRGMFQFTISKKTILEWHNLKIQLEDFAIGDNISITYSSDILESDPARIENILKITLLDDEI